MADPQGDRLHAAAERVIERLRATNRKIVLAESCTAGLIAATLGRTPGVSEYLCGSAVVYRDATKSAWLGVAETDLADPEVTAVSGQVAESMALGALLRTPEADLSASVTGYLGPDSPPGMDGCVFIGLAHRDGRRDPVPAALHQVRLPGFADRIARQQAAAAHLLGFVCDALADQ